jgi:hypothetical protein
MQLPGLSLRDGDLAAARRLAPSIPPDVLKLAVALSAVDAAKSGQVERAKALADLMPTPADRAAALQGVLTDSRNGAGTVAEVMNQIASLPTAYDRCIAYLGHAEDAWRCRGIARRGNCASATCTNHLFPQSHHSGNAQRTQNIASYTRQTIQFDCSCNILADQIKSELNARTTPARISTRRFPRTGSRVESCATAEGESRS